MSTSADNSITMRSRWAWAAVLALLLAAPFIGLYPIFMMKALCFAIFACAFNLLLGFTGLLSFGHAAYLGTAAYATGWLVRSAGWSPELGVLARSDAMVSAAPRRVMPFFPLRTKRPVRASRTRAAA